MIPGAYVQEWSAATPWPDPRQVEQDLIICRALCDIFNEPFLAERLSFRGGTAINKLLFRQPLRYSEDIDLVQVRPEPIGPTIDAIRRALSWLGPCRRRPAPHSTHLVFRGYSFSVENPWFAASTSIVSFEPEELFGTKLRALLQRRNNRDLFDINEGLTQLPLDPEKVVTCFHHYLAHEGTQITRANAEQRMLAKLTRNLTDDIAPLLSAGVISGDAEAREAFERVWFQLIARLSGTAWDRSEQVIEELRATSIPNLLRSAGAS